MEDFFYKPYVPAPILLGELLEENEKEIIYNNISYKIKIVLYTNIINIICVKKKLINSINYQLKFHLFDFKIKNQIFKEYNNISEINNLLKKSLDENNINIYEIKEDIISIRLKFKNRMNEIICVDLTLIKENINKDLLINDLCTEMNNINDRLTKLENLFNNFINKNNNPRNEGVLLNNENDNDENGDNENGNNENDNNENVNNENILNSSKILNNKNDLLFLEQRLQKNENFKKVKFNLIYSAKKDGDRASVFHSKCDEYNNTLCLIKTKNELIIGGFASETWKGDSVKKKDENAFVFSVSDKKIYEAEKNTETIYCTLNGACIFRCGILDIKDKMFENGGTTCLKKLSSFQGITKDFEINNSEKVFGIKEFEVYHITFI